MSVVVNEDIISIILKFVNFKTLSTFKLTSKSCKYLAELELQRRLKLEPNTNTCIPKDYIDASYLARLIKKPSDCLVTQLRILSILYILHDKSFRPVDWYFYNLPMQILYTATNDEFNTIFNHWLIQDYFKDLPGLWSREEVFMTWYDKMDEERQLFLKEYVLRLYKCPEEFVYVLTRTPPLFDFDEFEFVQVI